MAIRDYLPEAMKKAEANKAKIKAKDDKINESMDNQITQAFRRAASNSKLEQKIAFAVASGEPLIVNLSATRPINSLADVWGAVCDSFSKVGNITPEQVTNNEEFLAFNRRLKSENFEVAEVKTEKYYSGRHFSLYALLTIKPH